MFLSGPVTKGVNFSNAQSFGLATFGGGAAMNARVDSLQRLLTFDTGLRLVNAANGVLADSFRSAQEIDAALNGAPPLPVAFPNSGLGQQLAQVAQIISVRGALGMNRQIFFAGMGGFDNHEDLLAKQQDLMATFDAAVSTFVDTLDGWAHGPVFLMRDQSWIDGELLTLAQDDARRAWDANLAQPVEGAPITVEKHGSIRKDARTKTGLLGSVDLPSIREFPRGQVDGLEEREVRIPGGYRKSAGGTNVFATCGARGLDTSTSMLIS